MARNGWFNLENGTLVPDTQFFEGDSAFKSFGLSKKARLYGFIAWYGPIRIECTRYRNSDT